MLSSTSKSAALALALVAVLMSIGAATALASDADVFAVSNKEGSFDGFSKAELEHALNNVAADGDDYYACGPQIQAALAEKVTKKLPGGGSDVKRKLKKAGVHDLTTAAERKKLIAKVERSTEFDSSKPLPDSSDPAIATAGGRTLASSAAPGAPLALLIGVIGLALLAGADLTTRISKKARGR